MFRLAKKFPGNHAVMLFSAAVLTGMVGISDALLMDRFAWIDFFWLVPLVFAAVFLFPLEAVVIALGSSLINLSIQAATQTETIALWVSGVIALGGMLAASASAAIRRYHHRVNVVRDALKKSPLAYAEFKFPGYAITNYNRAFEEMSNVAVGRSPLISLFDAFPRDSAFLMAKYMDEAITKRTQTECEEFRLEAPEGKSTFWGINFVPISPSGRGTPKTVAVFAFEVTEAVARARTREAVHRISASAMSSLDLDETIRAAMDGLAFITGTNAGALFLIEDDQWVGKAGYGAHSDEVILKLRYPYDAVTPAVESVEGKEVIAVTDVTRDERFASEDVARLQVKSAMVVPLVSGNRAVGVVFLSHTDEARGFSEEQVKFATIIGSHAALAIENARIYQNELAMRKSLEAIEMVSEAGLVSSDLDEVLFELVNRTQDVMQMDAAMILLYDRQEDCLVGRAAAGGESPSTHISQTRLKVGEGIAGRALKEGTPLKIDDIRGNEEEVCPLEIYRDSNCPFSEKNGILSVLAVPLRVAGKVIGVLQIGSRRQAAFSAQEWGLIQVLADRASLVVQNSMLNEKTRRELARVLLLRDVVNACTSSRDVGAIAEGTLKTVYDRLGCQVASVYYLNREQEELVNLAYIGHSEQVRREYRVSPLDKGTLLTRAVNERRIITHEEVNLDNATESEARILKMLDIGYNRCARIPIVYQDEPIGAMALAFPDTRPFTHEGLETLKSISNLLAVAFKNSSPVREQPLLTD